MAVIVLPLGKILARCRWCQQPAMLPHEIQKIVPSPPPAAEILQQFQLTGEFYTEVKYRQQLEQHCQWYYQTAKQHQQELEKMRGDINILGWFRRRQA